MNTKTKELSRAEAGNGMDPARPLLPATLEDQCGKLDALADRYSLALGDATGRISRAVTMARAIQNLREAFTPELMGYFRSLQNTRLGFKTDRGPGQKIATPYSDEILRDAIIEALLSGVWVCGNHFNILAGGTCYITREGYEYKFASCPEITDLEVSPGVRTKRDGVTFIRMAARCKFRGIPIELKDHEGKPGRSFEIPSFESTGPDAVIGKGTRKALRAFWAQLFGSEHTPSDGEVIEGTATVAAIAGPSRSDQVAAAIGVAQPAREPGVEPEEVHGNGGTSISP